MSNVAKFEKYMNKYLNYSDRTITPSQLKEMVISAAQKDGLTGMELKNSLRHNRR